MKDLNLIAPLVDAVADMGYTIATPIQAKAIPLVLEGRDLIACASTGTGKTAAFLLPILQRLQGRHEPGCRALILSPTRELALQIDEQALALGYHLDISAVAVVGGVEMRPQERALREGSTMVVATPGRLLDHMRFKYVDLSKVEVLVLDEGDRMLDMGFLPDIQRILAALPVQRQTLLFSATMSPKIRQLANEILRDPAAVTVDPQRAADTITQSVCLVSQERKAALLSSLLRRAEMESVLVFVRRKIDADHRARAVIRGGVGATSIHADRTQAERVAALDGFRSGQFPVLIATDVAARGIDVSGISHVINYDVPHSAEDYIHRAGRTGRAGAAGHVITFVAPDEEERMAEIEHALGSPLPRVKFPGFEAGSHDASAHRGRGARPVAPARPASRGRRRSRPSGSRATQPANA